ncbi:hypothetical protein [Sorangium sp. So ce1389]|uniref:hypothetical protein n=1 Tax=Sorangium sp. So ce1389 TaxID=3133336 RepID=UPI003F5D7051
MTRYAAFLRGVSPVNLKIPERRISSSSDARLRHARRWLPFCQAMSANQTIIKIDAGASTVGGKKGETKL